MLSLSDARLWFDQAWNLLTTTTPLINSVGPIISGTGAIVAIRAAFFAKSKDKTMLAFAFLNEWRDETFYSDVIYILGSVKAAIDDKPHIIEGGIRGLPNDAKKRVQRVSHFFDYLGGSMIAGVVNKRLTLSAIGEPAIKLWDVLAPLIEKERFFLRQETPSGNIPHRDYQLGFEHFASQAYHFLRYKRLPRLGRGPYKGVRMPRKDKRKRFPTPSKAKR